MSGTTEGPTPTTISPTCPCPLCQLLTHTPLGASADAKELVAQITTSVVDHLLTGSNLGNLPDDMGVDVQYRLGTAFQNYLEWPARHGALQAFLDPNTIVKLVAVLDALVAVKDKTPQEQVVAASTALAAIESKLT